MQTPKKAIFLPLQVLSIHSTPGPAWGRRQWAPWQSSTRRGTFCTWRDLCPGSFGRGRGPKGMTQTKRVTQDLSCAGLSELSAEASRSVGS